LLRVRGGKGNRTLDEPIAISLKEGIKKTATTHGVNGKGQKSEEM